MSLDGQEDKNAGGYAMAALLVAIGVMGVMLLAAMPAWRQVVQREKEEELIFRGQQYARAIGLFQRKFGVSFPPNLDVLVEQRLLRKKYKDPMTADGEFQLLYQGTLVAAQRPGQGTQRSGLPGSGSSPFAQQSGRGTTGTGAGTGLGTGPGDARSGPGLAGARGGIVGVASKSTAKSIRLYNGRNYYNEWEFVFVPIPTRPGQMQQPGQVQPPGQRQGPFGGPGRGPGSGPGGQPGNSGGGPRGSPPQPRNPGGGPGGMQPPGD
jgi:type II secretory pathway pseudopilin PulG